VRVFAPAGEQAVSPGPTMTGARDLAATIHVGGAVADKSSEGIDLREGIALQRETVTALVDTDPIVWSRLLMFRPGAAAPSTISVRRSALRHDQP